MRRLALGLVALTMLSTGCAAQTTEAPPAASSPRFTLTETPRTGLTAAPTPTPTTVPPPSPTGPSPTSQPLNTNTPVPKPVPTATVAFMRYTDDSWDEYIYLVESDGTGLRKLTPDKDVREGYPQFSPDGQKLVFSRRPKGGNPMVWVMNVDGTGRIPLGSGEWADMPAWSPDGKRIAFVSAHDGQLEISVMSSDGSSVKRLTSDPSTEMLPVWSPDGTQIAFLSDRDGVHRWWVINADGSGQRLLADIKVYEQGTDVPPILLRALWGRETFFPGEYFLAPMITKDEQMVKSIYVPKFIVGSVTLPGIQNVTEITGATGIGGATALIATFWSDKTESFDIKCCLSELITSGPEQDFASSAMVLMKR